MKIVIDHRLELLRFKNGFPMSYLITFHIETDDVLKINKELGQKITIVKSDASVSDKEIVAWVAFEAQNTVTVSWEEEYFIYETSQEIKNGAKIDSSSNTGVVTKNELYTFADGAFTSSMGGLDGAFQAMNSGDGDYTFGLGQPATVGGQAVSAPISAMMVGNNQTVSFKPRVRLSVFLSATQDNGTVLSSVDGAACAFNLDTEKQSIILAFNGTNNTFQVSDSAALSRALMEEAKHSGKHGGKHHAR